ncbi:MAG: peptide ABC transporter substrate-binding protein [Proteobacteria bacterium]|nr:peptide ABC transporter substrate-binding protein [Pseudomonadota bacterium]
MTNDKDLLTVRNLVVEYFSNQRPLSGEKLKVRAVNDISFGLKRGETLGIVGESGCGKTSTALAILKMIDSTSGEILFDQISISSLNKRKFRPLRQKLQMIYQDPFGALNPRMAVRDIVGEPLKAHKKVRNRKDYDSKIDETLEIVGLSREMGKRYPHEFSGGQRQRIGIARAIILKPDLIVCDEPVSALDVSIQAQIINLLEQLQQDFNIAYLFIAHDLAVVQHISHKVIVMYLGKIVEMASREELYESPKHPYTQALLSAIPIPSPDLEATREIKMLEGEIPSPLNPPSGCSFHNRCPLSKPECTKNSPKTTKITNSHSVACHLYS